MLKGPTAPWLLASCMALGQLYGQVLDKRHGNDRDLVDGMMNKVTRTHPDSDEQGDSDPPRL